MPSPRLPQRDRTIEVIHCGYDMEAKQRTDDLLAQRPEFRGVEVWELDRRVYVNMVGNPGRGVA
jgi:hypothetical protein